MRFVALLGIVAFFSVLCFTSVSSANEKLFVEVKKPYTNIYRELDPKSEIIEQAKKGDHLELVFEGTSWYHVKIKNSFGWIEKRSGEITDKSSSSSIVTIVLLVVLIGGTFGGVSYYIYKNKLAGA